MFRVIIAGTRTFSDYERLKEFADRCLSKISESKNIEIVSGHARGADALGEKYAKERGYDLKIFPADWERYGKIAGHLRNIEMAEYADALIAFWDDASRGTQDMIRIAERNQLKVRVDHYTLTTQTAKELGIQKL